MSTATISPEVSRTSPFSRSRRHSGRNDHGLELGFKAVNAVVGATSVVCVWHLHTANKYGAYCFLTTDSKFVNATRQAKKRRGFPNLVSKPMLPSELAATFSLKPIHSFAVSYRDQVFAVRPELHLPDEKRTHGSRFRKKNLVRREDRRTSLLVDQIKSDRSRCPFDRLN
ncbi:hypothetical protein JJB09_26240 [Rhizobium sp. KVB221]|uniref:Uncharacterized protein n=1 Tax=Rhizobium setariae TaxID=2801340 RepID=A0A936YUR9_9HYPH|nr:hypothetical protein [Rhizobium setariae]MBL0375512.1 hypothetical protein [Rhizobium setariae]